jgi:cysteine dioxygenase
MQLPDFFETLNRYTHDVPIADLVELLKDLEVCVDDVAPCVAFDGDHYKRNLLSIGDGYAALIMCWRPGQQSTIHDHRGSACAVKVLRGVASETRFERGADGMLTEGARATFHEGSVCGSYDADIHVLANRATDDTDLVTLHVYTPPLQAVRTYCLESTEIGTWTDDEALRAMAERHALRV